MPLAYSLPLAYSWCRLPRAPVEVAEIADHVGAPSGSVQDIRDLPVARLQAPEPRAHRLRDRGVVGLPDVEAQTLGTWARISIGTALIGRLLATIRAQHRDGADRGEERIFSHISCRVTAQDLHWLSVLPPRRARPRFRGSAEMSQRHCHSSRPGRLVSAPQVQAHVRQLAAVSRAKGRQPFGSVMARLNFLPATPGEYIHRGSVATHLIRQNQSLRLAHAL